MKEVAQSALSAAAPARPGLSALLTLWTARNKSIFQVRLEQVSAWFRLKELEYALRKSRSFEKYCEKIGCPALAELEKNYQETLVRNFRARATFAQNFPPHTAQTENSTDC